MRELSRRVRKIIADHLNIDLAEVTEYSIFIDDLGADSLDVIELIMMFENEFGCLIPDDAVAKIVTVKDAINFIEAQKGISEPGTVATAGISPVGDDGS